MTETAQRKCGGRAFHSIVEPHFDFIQQLRQRRKTWQEIAELLFTEKGIRVTLYAPYRFYRRRLKRAAKPDWKIKENIFQFQPANQSAAANQSPASPAPLPAQKPFKRPHRFNLETDQFT